MEEITFSIIVCIIIVNVISSICTYPLIKRSLLPPRDKTDKLLWCIIEMVFFSNSPAGEEE